MLTPLELNVLKHCYCIAEKHPDFDIPVYTKVHKKFIGLGIIEHDIEKDIYRTTERGNAWMRSILRTPTPECVYIDPRTKEIIE